MLPIVRYVAIALVLIMGSVGASLWWIASNLPHYQQDVESTLKDHFKLQALKLGKLGWHWSGMHVVFTFHHSSLSNQDESLRIQAANLQFRLFLPKLLLGNTMPNQLALSNGDIWLAIPANETLDMSIPMPPLALDIHDINVHWKYQQSHGELANTSLRFHPRHNTLDIQADKLQAKLRWQHPESLAEASLHMQQGMALPEPISQYLRGNHDIHLQLQALDQQHWQISASVTGAKEQSYLHIPQQPKLPFERIECSATVVMDGMQMRPKRIQLDSLQWNHAQHQLMAKGDWQEDILSLQASTSHLGLSYVWPQLVQLDNDPQWASWLSQMQQGTITRALANIDLHWANLVPDMQDLERMHYQVDASISNAEIYPELQGDAIQGIAASVHIDPQGIHATISQAELPQAIGKVAGTLDIRWDDLHLHTQGNAQVDAAKLQTWAGNHPMQGITFQQLPSQAQFDIQWLLEQEHPEVASITLSPSPTWQASLHGMPVEVKRGDLLWQFGQGLRSENLCFQAMQSEGRVRFHAEDNEQGWKLKSADITLDTPMQALAEQLQLPVENPQGTWHTQLQFDRAWHGYSDGDDVAWSWLLGTEKTAVQPLRIQWNAAMKKKLQLRFQSHESWLQSDGTLTWEDNNDWMLVIKKLHSPAFRGQLSARFNQDQGQANIHAAYINSHVFPDNLAHFNASTPFQVVADIEHFDADQLQLYQVRSSYHTGKDAGTLQANHMTYQSFPLNDLGMQFSKQPNGILDIQHFSAQMDDLPISFRGQIQQHGHDRFSWNGTSSISGNHSAFMRLFDMPGLFDDGQMQLDFTGQGNVAPKQAWWQGISGDINMHVEDGVLHHQAGTISKLLAAMSIINLPKTLIGDRQDLTQKGMFFDSLDMKAHINGAMLQFEHLLLRASAMDLFGKGHVDMAQKILDMIVVAKPFQTVDAVVSNIPLLGKLFTGESGSVLRRTYRLQGPIANAEPKTITAKDAGLERAGLIEDILSVPEAWLDIITP